MMSNNKIVIIVVLLCCLRYIEAAPPLTELKTSSDNGTGSAGSLISLSPFHAVIQKLIKIFFISFRSVHD